MKKIVLLLLILMIFTSCTNQSDSAELDYRLDKVLAMNDTLEFSVYLERPDLNLSEPDQTGSIYVSNLPLGIQAKTISVDDNVVCNPGVLPHSCVMDMDFEEDALMTKHVLKVEFKDGGVAESDILIPNVKSLDKPEIIPPEEDKKTDPVLTFIDIGADRYEVSAHLCYEYQNDGINPCLDGDEYTLTRENEKLILEDNQNFYQAELAQVEDQIKLTFAFDVSNYESVLYEVRAFQDGGKYGSTDISRESSDELEVLLRE